MPFTETSPSLHWQSWGETGPMVALVHEIGGSIASWEPVASLLADEFRLLALDQRGAGLSEKPRGRLDLEDQVDDLEAVLAAAGEAGPLHLAGAAAGAAIVAGYALRHPDRVTSLALCVPAVESDPRQAAAAGERAALVRREGMRGLADSAFAAIYPERIRDGRFADYRGRWLAWDPESYALLGEALARVRLPLEELRAPCLLLAGELDPARPPAAVAELAERFADARFECVPDTSHVVPYQAPEDVARRLRSFFLAPRP
ncbi:MAG: alpha/beta hydrolase [Solirubrobacterales bacterium]